MQKIMFNERYGLTTAVLQGSKTMTRRIVGNRMTEDDIKAYLEGYREQVDKLARYKIGEVVAVAQSYHSILDEMFANDYTSPIYDPFRSKKPDLEEEKGWTNKMFVKASYMPHRIRFTDIKVERLQDISDEDCLKEGILHSDKYAMPYGITDVTAPNGVFFYYSSPREAFAALIDKVSGKGTWKCNPYELAYSFELVK